MMTVKAFRRGVLLLAVGVLASTAPAGTIVLGGGWQANWANGAIGITVDQVTDEYVTIQISKDFTEGSVDGVFPALLIDFIQIADDANTVPRIIINDETITNLTGEDWTDFHWEVLNHGDAWFNVPESMAFDTTPFPTKVFSDPFNIFGDPDKASALDVYDGLVPNFGSFFPGLAGGDLVIDVDLSPDYPVSFTLKEYPTPEPASMLLFGLGALVLRRR